jgi:hypothetical protein
LRHVDLQGEAIHTDRQSGVTSCVTSTVCQLRS